LRQEEKFRPGSLIHTVVFDTTAAYRNKMPKLTPNPDVCGLPPWGARSMFLMTAISFLGFSSCG
jgi:hypothetical protein